MLPIRHIYRYKVAHRMLPILGKYSGTRQHTGCCRLGKQMGQGVAHRMLPIQTNRNKGDRKDVAV